MAAYQEKYFMHEQSRCDYCADFDICIDHHVHAEKLGYDCPSFNPIFPNVDPKKFKSLLNTEKKMMKPPEGMKICTKCKTPKPATDEYFYKKTKNKDGLMYQCRICHNKYVKRPKPIVNPPLYSKIVVEVDVTAHQSLYAILKKTAEKNFRTVSNQILFMMSELSND